jgi:phosphoglycolate phosphatase
MKYQLAIFDCDGTLVDSFPWFQKMVNVVADEFHLRRVDPDELTRLRSYDIRTILNRLQVPAWTLPRIARYVRQLKAQQLHEIALFPGVERALHDLAQSGIILAVVSSDSEDNVRTSLGPHNERLITHYACGASLFGKSKKFRTVLRRSRIAPAKSIAIGDETRDAEAARAAGLAFGAVTWGYANAEALQAMAPQEMFSSIKDIVTKLA